MNLRLLLLVSAAASICYAAVAQTTTYRLTEVGVTGSRGTPALALNAAGQVTGRSLLGSNVAVHAFMWDGSAMHDLGTLGASQSSGFALNATLASHWNRIPSGRRRTARLPVGRRHDAGSRHARWDE